MRNKELVRLMAGFKRFRLKYFDGENSIYRKLSQSGQNPKTLVIACSDSRVDPAIISSAAPGDLFVVRNVANLVPPFEDSEAGFHGVSSAIEFAVVNLMVKNIIVLGHRQCGGIRALMTGVSNPEPSFISRWVNIAAKAKQVVLQKHPDDTVDAQCTHCEMEAIRVSLDNLRTFPFVAKAIEAYGLELYGLYFDIEEGQIMELSETTGEFAPLEV